LFKKLVSDHKNFSFVPTLSQPKGEWKGDVGRITKYLDEHSSEFMEHLAYICGGTQMIKDTRALLISKGFNPRNIKLEVFG